MITIDCISDLHGHYPELPGGDLLLVAGDLTKNDTPECYKKFADWLKSQKYNKKVLIGGNHDNRLEKISPPNKTLFLPYMVCDYLCDSGTEFEGLKIWGSPWTKSFPGMNPNYKAFTVDTEEELAEKWALIPADIDILVTHSPPYDFRDHVKDKFGYPTPMGSESLYSTITQRAVPKIHVFGHIHEGYGVEIRNEFYPPNADSLKEVQFINASLVNERYEPVNKPIRVVL